MIGDWHGLRIIPCMDDVPVSLGLCWVGMYPPMAAGSTRPAQPNEIAGLMEPIERM